MTERAYRRRDREVLRVTPAPTHKPTSISLKAPARDLLEQVENAFEKITGRKSPRTLVFTRAIRFLAKEMVKAANDEDRTDTITGRCGALTAQAGRPLTDAEAAALAAAIQREARA